jgi:hypothetical protein
VDLWYEVIKMAFYLCDLPPSNSPSQSSQERTNILREEHLTKYIPVLLKTIKISKNKEILSCCQSHRRLKKHDN